MGLPAKIANHIKREFLTVLPVTVFFVVGLNLIAFSKHLILAEQGILYEGVATATFGALVIAKIVLVVDKLPFMRFSADRPLYQPIVLRAVFYSICVWAFRLIETLVGHWIETGDFSAGVDRVGASFIWHHIIFLQLWTVVLFLVYLTVAELLEVVGDGSRVRGLFFKRGSLDSDRKVLDSLPRKEAR